ncbi:glycosyltransferase family 4 protein [Thermodesulfatator atlanticus]|uniref:glycosyltransferase family 4 protein n=1 Tax=Thermodesulfatator atlanticus TaxID=501497 RepID=UPI0003B64917|nr:glycosyltransferase family 4 protein [Thermodesulfatator atlanticus]
MLDIFFSYDFFPKIGGAHLWLYKVAYHWQRSCIYLTQEMPEMAREVTSFDAESHGPIKEIVRLPFCVSSWGIDKNFIKNTALLHKFLSGLRKKEKVKQVTVHAVKAIPEAANLLWLKFWLRDNLRLITYAHGEEFLVAKTSKELRWLARKALEASDFVIANSFSTAKLIENLLGERSKAKENKVIVVHLGVDFELYQLPKKERKTHRKAWGFPEEAVILITVARMEPRKNQEAVIKAMARLHQEGVPVAYVIAGSGEKEKELKGLVERLGLKRWVRFLGRISEEEKIKSICAADIHVMPSIQIGPMIEGFGIVFMEAAAAGLPSIAGKVGGQPEAVVHGETGLVVDGTNLDEIVWALKRLATDKELRRKMGEQARTWAQKHDWKNISQRIFGEITTATTSPRDNR